MNYIKIISFVGFPGILSMLGFILAKFNEYRKKLTANEEGTKALLRSTMLSVFYDANGKGYRSEWDTQNFISLHEAYKGLHGNSFIDDVYKRFMDIELEVK